MWAGGWSSDVCTSDLGRPGGKATPPICFRSSSMITKPEIFDMTAAPMRIGAVHLKVRDLEAVAAFYQRILGLRKLNEGDRTTTLGAGNTPLLVLDGDAGLLPGDRRA